MARKLGIGVLLAVPLWLYFRSRSTARGARTIITRKFSTGVLLPVALWLYFLSRLTARGARTIMARKLGIGVLLAVPLWLYFRSSVPRDRVHTPCSTAECAVWQQHPT